MLLSDYGLLLVLLVLVGCEAGPEPSPPNATQRSRPSVKHATYVANVSNPLLSRDSCGSTRISNRVFWACRDTSRLDESTGKRTLPTVTNSASWTNRTAFGHPSISKAATSQDTTRSLTMYGGHGNALSPYFPLVGSECPITGMCMDGTRWAVWPDQPPVIVQEADDGSATGYTWVRKVHLKSLEVLNSEPAYTLYKTSYHSSDDLDSLPTASIVDGEFWRPGEIGYGQYGSVLRDNVLYLYGQTNNKRTAIAKVSVDSVENRTAYQYYCNGAWTRIMPATSDPSVVIPYAGAGGQGTFYHSAFFDAYVWIGQPILSVSADFYITTAPAPEGAWEAPFQIFAGQNGDGEVAGGYSLQANPALLPSRDASESGMYLTWTQQWKAQTYGGVYVTPLVWVEFDQEQAA